MTDREKLIELLHKGVRCPGTVDGLGCSDCPHHSDDDPCDAYGATADMLIAHGVTVQEWISVKDRLPEDDLPKDTKRRMIRCLVYTDKGTVKPCVRQRWEHFNGKMQPWMWNKDLYAKPTHWMPLPKPPKEDKND